MAAELQQQQQNGRADTVRSFLAWVMIPSLLAAVAGAYVNYKVHWLSVIAVMSFLLSFVPLWPVFRSKSSGRINWRAIFGLFLHVVLFASAGYFEWDHLGWPVSPWLGAGVMIVIWIGVMIAISSLVGLDSLVTKKSNARSALHAHVNQPSEGAMRVSHKLAAKLGLPIGSDAELDIAKWLEKLETLAETDQIEADTNRRREERELLVWAVEKGFVQAEEVTDKVRAMLGITKEEIPAKPQRTTQSTDFSGFYRRSNRRKMRHQ